MTVAMPATARTPMPVMIAANHSTIRCATLTTAATTAAAAATRPNGNSPPPGSTIAYFGLMNVGMAVHLHPLKLALLALPCQFAAHSPDESVHGSGSGPLTAPNSFAVATGPRLGFAFPAAHNDPFAVAIRADAERVHIQRQHPPGEHGSDDQEPGHGRSPATSRSHACREPCRITRCLPSCEPGSLPAGIAFAVAGMKHLAWQP